MAHPKPFSVLVVDDYPDSAEATAQLVGLYGYDAVAARSYREAVDLVAGGFAPDLVILDIRLPDGDGCALADDLCRALARRPVLVAVTGMQGEMARCHAAGFNHVLIKPADTDEMRALLDRYAVGGSPGQAE